MASTSVRKQKLGRGFTLIELSIVLVIVGLVAGGILVGRDLIAASQIRGQISQIEKYQQAVNAFKVKYGSLPGDIPNADAIRFGFAARGSYVGQGDGNSVLDGNYSNSTGSSCSSLSLSCPFQGEQAMFWVDLSTAKLIEGNFSKATATSVIISTVVNTAVAGYMPRAKLNNNSYVYVWSSGALGLDDGQNRFSVSGVNGGIVANGTSGETPSMTVSQAYNIDKKIDDGLPQYGNILAISPSAGPTQFDGFSCWAAGGGYTDIGYGILQTINYGDYNSTTPGPVTSISDIGNGTTAGINSCYDGSGGLPEKYSINTNGGRGMNCWLSFKMQ